MKHHTVLCLCWVLGDFDMSGAPEDGLRYGHLEVTGRTELFPPQPLLDTLRRQTKGCPYFLFDERHQQQPKHGHQFL